jgi:hypothetical protein
MDDTVMAAKVAARQIAPDGPNSLWVDLEAAWLAGHMAGMTLTRSIRDSQLDASRAHVARLERQLATQMTGDFR